MPNAKKRLLRLACTGRVQSGSAVRGKGQANKRKTNRPSEGRENGNSEPAGQHEHELEQREEKEKERNKATPNKMIKTGKEPTEEEKKESTDNKTGQQGPQKQGSMPCILNTTSKAKVRQGNIQGQRETRNRTNVWVG